MKEIFGIIALILTLLAFLPYIHAIRYGHIRPHAFSWIIWGITTLLVFFAQLADRGGLGAWPIGFSGAITLYVAFLAYRHQADESVTRADWFFFLLALTALPSWALTSNPLWAVLILTTVDLLGFIPTFRKAYYAPFEEMITLYGFTLLRNIFALGALENYSLTTVTFPAVLSFASLALILMLLYRRRVLEKKPHACTKAS